MSSNDDAPATRLYLVAPAVLDVEAFGPILESALQGGDVAAVLIASSDILQVSEAAMALAPIAQAAGAACLVADDSRVVGRAKADGIHITSGLADISGALERFKPDGIVGAGNVRTRHDAMQIGELSPDYLMFGCLDKSERDEPDPQLLALASWWVELFEIPAITMAGASLETLDLALDTRAEFVAARSCVWTYSEGPAAAVARINAHIEMEPTRFA